LSLAAAALRAGELVIYPTDTLYALGAQASNALAVGRVRLAKGREAEKALPLVASDAAQAATLSASSRSVQMSVIRNSSVGCAVDGRIAHQT
jgi:L-threonylcarbamoyladenylate synthase